jgi:hypothetical protein
MARNEDEPCLLLAVSPTNQRAIFCAQVIGPLEVGQKISGGDLDGWTIFAIFANEATAPSPESPTG